MSRFHLSRTQLGLIFALLLVGLLVAGWLLSMRQLTPAADADAPDASAETLADGPHQGQLLGRDQPLQLEVLEQAQGHGKLQLRFYALQQGRALEAPARLAASWTRFGQTHDLRLQAEAEGWLGLPALDEPHSFVLTARLTYQGQTYSYRWERSENRLSLTPEQLRENHIGFAVAGPHTLSDTVELPGRIAVNQERYVHVTPRISGVVTKVYKHLGESVRRGEVLAVLESRELGDLRLDYLTAAQQLRQAQQRYALEQNFFNASQQLLAGLRRGEDSDSLHARLLDTAIGSDRQSLIEARSRYRLARETLRREERLRPSHATSEADYDAARQQFVAAEAGYLATGEEVARQRRLSLLERRQDVERLSPARDMARKQLELLGLPADSESTRYELRAPMSGSVLSQHIAVGEALAAGSDVFVLADLSEVWAEMMIPELRLDAVKLHQGVEVVSQTGRYRSVGTISHLGALVDEASRTAEAHAVVTNAAGVWKPGMFVSIRLQTNPYRVPLAVKPGAIQTLEGGPVVFVRDGEALQATPVTLGRSSPEWVEIRSGLRPGQSYVAANSFLLRAELEKALAAED